MAATTEQQIAALFEGIEAKHAALITGAEQMRSEVKNFGAASEETKSRVDSILTDINKLRDEQKALRVAFESNAYSDGGPLGAKSAGDQFVGSDNFKSMLTSGGFRSGMVNVKGMFERKDITSAAASVGVGVPQATRLPLMNANPHIALRLRDLMNVVQTSATSVEYLQYTFTNNAAIIYAAGPPVTRENLVKPKSDMTMTTATAVAETIAHWVAVSKQIYNDIPTIGGIINGELMYGLKYKEESQILNGNGTGGQMNGLMNQASAYDTTLLGAGPTKLDVLRASSLQVELAEYPADAYVLNPRDLFDIEIDKDDTGRYIIGNPQGTINPTLWGLPVVKSKSMAYGSFLTGSFAMGATLYDREVANIEMTDSHSDFFVRNMLAIRCEERLILTVQRPQAFAKGTF
jgi:HK97 family phage major capsid protein